MDMLVRDVFSLHDIGETYVHVTEVGRCTLDIVKLNTVD